MDVMLIISPLISRNRVHHTKSVHKSSWHSTTRMSSEAECSRNRIMYIYPHICVLNPTSHKLQCSGYYHLSCPRFRGSYIRTIARTISFEISSWDMLTAHRWVGPSENASHKTLTRLINLLLHHCHRSQVLQLYTYQSELTLIQTSIS